jgi:hypothetical protein
MILLTVPPAISAFDYKDILTAVSVATALIVAIYSIINTRRTIYINAVTTARIKYMDNLRSLIAEYCGLNLHYCLTDIKDPVEIQQIIKKIDQLRFTIKLNLNRNDPFDIKVIETVDLIPKFTAPEKFKELEKQLEILVAYSQDVLNLEWQGIKTEAKKGHTSKKRRKELVDEHLKGFGK